MIIVFRNGLNFVLDIWLMDFIPLDPYFELFKVDKPIPRWKKISHKDTHTYGI